MDWVHHGRLIPASFLCPLSSGLPSHFTHLLRSVIHMKVLPAAIHVHLLCSPCIWHEGLCTAHCSLVTNLWRSQGSCSSPVAPSAHIECPGCLITAGSPSTSPVPTPSCSPTPAPTPSTSPCMPACPGGVPWPLPLHCGWLFHSQFGSAMPFR